MPDNDYRTHEILLENRHLAFVGAGVLVLCVGSFLLGRWTERSRWVSPDSDLPRVADATGNLPIESGPAPAAAAAPDDDGQEGEELLPEETRPAAPEAGPAPAATAALEPRTEKARQAPADDLYIQVLATRHQDAADALRQKLAGRSYPAAVVSSPDSKGRPMYRVRVGGYETRQEADRVAAQLRKEERLKTWIP